MILVKFYRNSNCSQKTPPYQAFFYTQNYGLHLWHISCAQDDRLFAFKSPKKKEDKTMLIIFKPYAPRSP